jgi:hypothetical protein
VGTAGFSAGKTDTPSLAFSPSGDPYVAFKDSANSAKATVMKFDGISWVIVGAAGFSAGLADYTSLAISPSGEPFVAYMDGGNSYKATVMKYDFPIGINDPKESGFSLYPNPATDIVTIETSGIAKESYLAILNSQGQKLITRQITKSKTQLDISSLPGGVYLVRLTNDKTVQVGKIIKGGR